MLFWWGGVFFIEDIVPGLFDHGVVHIHLGLAGLFVFRRGERRPGIFPNFVIRRRFLARLGWWH
jgi:hypothetical protein